MGLGAMVTKLFGAQYNYKCFDELKWERWQKQQGPALPFLEYRHPKVMFNRYLPHTPEHIFYFVADVLQDAAWIANFVRLCVLKCPDFRASVLTTNLLHQALTPFIGRGPERVSGLSWPQLTEWVWRSPEATQTVQASEDAMEQDTLWNCRQRMHASFRRAEEEDRYERQRLHHDGYSRLTPGRIRSSSRPWTGRRSPTRAIERRPLTRRPVGRDS